MSYKKRPGKIFLIGYRATGKSSVGIELSRMLGCAFVDLDDRIENSEGATISEIVEKRGWDEFRKMERNALQEAVDSHKNCVVACGGGVVLQEDLMEKVKDKYLVAWLTAPLEVLKKRIGSDSRSATRRPALSGENAEEEISRVFEQREPLYRKFSHLEIDTFEKGPFQLAREICEAMKYAG
jgi:shikimate kinase